MLFAVKEEAFRYRLNFELLPQKLLKYEII